MDDTDDAAYVPLEEAAAFFSQAGVVKCRRMPIPIGHKENHWQPLLGSDRDARALVCAFNPRGSYVAVGTENGRIDIWSFTACKVLVTTYVLPESLAVQAATGDASKPLKRGGSFADTGSAPTSPPPAKRQCLEPSTPRSPRAAHASRAWACCALSWSRNSRYIVAAYNHRGIAPSLIVLWRIEDGAVAACELLPEASIQHVAVSPAAGVLKCTACAWDGALWLLSFDSDDSDVAGSGGAGGGGGGSGSGSSSDYLKCTRRELWRMPLPPGDESAFAMGSQASAAPRKIRPEGLFGRCVWRGDGRAIYHLTALGTILLVDPDSGAILREIKLPQGASSRKTLELTPDGGKQLLVATGRGLCLLPADSLDLSLAEWFGEKPVGESVRRYWGVCTLAEVHGSDSPALTLPPKGAAAASRAAGRGKILSRLAPAAAGEAGAATANDNCLSPGAAAAAEPLQAPSWASRPFSIVAAPEIRRKGDTLKQTWMFHLGFRDKHRQEVLAAPRRQGVTCLVARPRHRCLVATTPEGDAFYIEEVLKTDFPGPMYPAGYTLLDDNTFYEEAEDELDTVVSKAADGTEVRHLAREVVIPGKHEITHREEEEQEEQQGEEVDVFGGDDDDSAVQGLSFGHDELKAVPMAMARSNRSRKQVAAAAAAAAAGKSGSQAALASQELELSEGSVVAALLPPPAQMRDGTFRRGEAAEAAAERQEVRRLAAAAYKEAIQKEKDEAAEAREVQLERERRKEKAKYVKVMEKARRNAELAKERQRAVEWADEARRRQEEREERRNIQREERRKRQEAEAAAAAKAAAAAAAAHAYEDRRAAQYQAAAAKYGIATAQYANGQQQQGQQFGLPPGSSAGMYHHVSSSPAQSPRYGAGLPAGQEAMRQQQQQQQQQQQYRAPVGPRPRGVPLPQQQQPPPQQHQPPPNWPADWRSV